MIASDIKSSIRPDFPPPGRSHSGLNLSYVWYRLKFSAKSYRRWQFQVWTVEERLGLSEANIWKNVWNGTAAPSGAAPTRLGWRCRRQRRQLHQTERSKRLAAEKRNLRRSSESYSTRTPCMYLKTVVRRLGSESTSHTVRAPELPLSLLALLLRAKPTWQRGVVQPI